MTRDQIIELLNRLLELQVQAWHTENVGEMIILLEQITDLKDVIADAAQNRVG